MVRLAFIFHTVIYLFQDSLFKSMGLFPAYRIFLIKYIYTYCEETQEYQEREKYILRQIIIQQDKMKPNYLHGRYDIKMFHWPISKSR